jgi:ketosteroid isomerase-like protein
MALFGFAGMLLMAGCNKVAPVDTQAAEKAVKNADMQWSKAAGAHDFNNLFAYYADDATVLPANEEMLTNKPGVQKYWSDHLTKDVSVSWTPMYVEAAKSGDMVYDLGSYTMTTKAAKGKGAATTDHGKYMAVWKKQADGSWKAEADSWNSDLAAKTK